jgi:hypothetical protein
MAVAVRRDVPTLITAKTPIQNLQSLLSSVQDGTDGIFEATWFTFSAALLAALCCREEECKTKRAKGRRKRSEENNRECE